ncbi:S-layer homology domain-containing protein [Adlercreutzia equolifaciens]|uniref:S-layer homology domain-containing protein n=1 Tax=Adlercreutzia equolifaciens TaxID=446660 RepID=UPI0023AF2369|nr:S-layer homology domain-containing protein [Adlercreutzia equolifaciens]MDE8701486.1 S-layer homology domain-containing protein [Adlercreutzia equolifaciens]
MIKPQFKRVTSACAMAGLSLATAVAVAMPVGLANADTVVQWPTPDSDKPYMSYTLNNDGSIKSQQVLSAIYGYYTPLSSYLGLTNTTVVNPSSGSSGGASDNILDQIAANGLYGTYASPANQNLDPYWANVWLKELKPSLGITPNADKAPGHEVALVPSERGMASANLSLYEDSGVSASFYYRPQIIAGGQNAYAGYAEMVDKINATGKAHVAGADKDAENGIGLENYQAGDESYDPIIITQHAKAADGAYIAAGSMNGNMQTLYLLAAAAEDVMASDPTFVTRYGDPTEIAADIEELSYGSRYYVLKGIEQGTIQKKTVAYVNSIDAAEQTAQLTIVDPTAFIGDEKMGYATNYFHPAIDLQDITTNLVDKLDKRGDAEWAKGFVWNGDEMPPVFGYVNVPIADLAKADVLMCSQGAAMGGGAKVSQADLSAAFDVAGVAEKDRPVAFINTPTDLGLGGWNSDRICYMPAFIGFIYPEVAPASEMMAYYYSTVSHVKDQYLDDTVAINCSKLSLRSGDTLAAPAGGYASKFAAIKSKLVEGMKYYAANQSSIDAKHLNLTGIKDGSGNLRNPRYQNGNYLASAVGLFSDVTNKNADWEIDMITRAVNAGLMTGYSDSGKFGPYDTLTREMAVTVLYRAMANPEAGEAPGTDTGGYKDVKAGQWYTKAVKWAKDNNIATGYGDGTFGIGKAISRAELANMVHRAAGSPTASSSDAFNATTDKHKVPDWAQNALTWTAANEILSGVDNGAAGKELQPNSPVLRVQMAKIIVQSVDHLK